MKAARVNTKMNPPTAEKKGNLSHFHYVDAEMREVLREVRVGDHLVLVVRIDIYKYATNERETNAENAMHAWARQLSSSYLRPQE